MINFKHKSKQNDFDAASIYALLEGSVFLGIANKPLGFLPEESVFLSVTCGDVVIVQDNQLHAPESWWMGEIIHIVSGARSLEPSLFQVACIDTGVIKTVNADQVTKVVRSVRSQHQQNACISEK